jgi:ABC-type transporter Mla MlaB component
VLRISTNNNSENLTLTVEGWLVGPWVDELRKETKLALGHAKAVTLDLQKLWFTDPSGLALLRELMMRNVAFIHCSTFISQQLKEAM